MTKSAGNYEFGNIIEEILNEKLDFFCNVYIWDD